MRTFTPAELYATTTADLEAMSKADQNAYIEAILAHWSHTCAKAEANYLSGDYNLIGSRRAYEHVE
jgi:hypothetical protein